MVEVDQKIQEEKDKISQANEKLSSESLMKPDTDTSEALNSLKKAKKEFDDSVVKLNKCKQYQDTLEIPPVEI